MPSLSEMPDFWLEVPVARSFLVSCKKCRFNDPRNYYWRPTKKQKHEGIDLAATNASGAPIAVLAAQRGIVDRIAYSARGYGNYVRLIHKWHDGNTYVTWYAHLSQITVRKGDYVKAGDQVGVAGSTGYTVGLPHLHLTLQKLGAGKKGYVIDDVIDPEPYFIQENPPQLTEASFVKDVTVADGVLMRPGQAFTKTWRIRNSGNVSWKGDYRFLSVSDERMGASTNVPLPAAEPGQEVDVAVTFTAPEKPGRYVSVWQGRDPKGNLFPRQFFAEIQVEAEAEWNELSWVADVTVASRAVVPPGQSFLKTWLVRNSGSTAWTEGFRLSYFEDEQLNGPESVPLPEAEPGEEVEVSVSLVAPETPGLHRSIWKPTTPKGEFFEFAQSVEIEVPSPIPTGEDLDEARYVTDVTIPDGTTVQPETTFTKTWRMRNSGTTTWGPGYALVFFDGHQMGETNSVPLPETAPGMTVDVTVELKAPSKSGEHRSTWKPRNAEGTFFDFAMFTEIVVATSLPNSNQMDELQIEDDLSVAPGSAVPAGYPFFKKWRIRNGGSTTWGPGYVLAPAVGDPVQGPDSAPLPNLAPGQRAEVSILLNAPTTAGSYRSVWTPRNAAGNRFQHDLVVEVLVMPPPAAVGEDEASLLEHLTMPPGVKVRPGETFTKSWRLRNSGNTNWNGGYAVAFEGGTAMTGPGSVSLTPAVPEESANVSVVLTAPVRPGQYEATWRSRNPSGRLFGDILPLSFEVMETETHDMLAYLRGDGRQYEMRFTWDDGGVHLVQTQQESDGGNERFYHVRNSQWEEFWFDQEYIYRGISTTTSSGTFSELSQNGQHGSPWIPRHMALHTFFRRSPILTLSRKDNCQLINRFTRVSWIRLEALHPALKLPGGLVLQNVAELAAFDDVNGRPTDSPFERYLFAEGYGLVAWQGKRGHLVMTKELAPGSVPRNRRELISCS